METKSKFSIPGENRVGLLSLLIFTPIVICILAKSGLPVHDISIMDHLITWGLGWIAIISVFAIVWGIVKLMIKDRSTGIKLIRQGLLNMFIAGMIYSLTNVIACCILPD